MNKIEISLKKIPENQIILHRLPFTMKDYNGPAKISQYFKIEKIQKGLFFNMNNIFYIFF